MGKVDFKADYRAYALANPNYDEGIAKMDEIMKRNDGRGYYASLRECYGRAELQQIMPIPDNMAVMIAVDPEEDRWVCCDSRDLNRPYALAVVNIQFGAEVVPIDLVESTIDIDAQLVNRHKCIKCGREMKIRLEPGQGGYRAKYECKECNRLIELDPDGTEEEVNE